MSVRRALVVGAGIAGSTLAFLLARGGVEVTVVERAGGQRSAGSPVDVRGPALPVVARMNVLPSVRAAATRTTRLAAVDAAGREIGSIPTQVGRRAIEIPRDDLCAILASAAGQVAEIRYDETVVDLRQAGDGIEVMFERSTPSRYDLVIGADGVHSVVRRLAFGPESSVLTHLGLFIATFMLDHTSNDRRTVLIHSAPGRSVVIHPTTGREGAAFIFRHTPLPVSTFRDRSIQDELLTAAYPDRHWRVPELLDRALNGSDRYFDAVSRVRMDRWSHGRIVLAGDAATCVSLFGEGSSMAIAGAATLAECLFASADTAAALRRYERLHRRRVRPHQLGGYIAAVVVNAVLLVLVNVTPGWSILPFLTPDMAFVLPWINASMVAGIMVNAVYLFRDTPRIKGFGDLITEVIGLVAMIGLWQVFPFDFGAGSSGWATVVRVALVIGIVGTIIAMIVSVVMVIRGTARPASVVTPAR